MGRFIWNNYWHELFYPYGCEPAVTRCIAEGPWQGGVFWDVGAFVGRYTWRFAANFKQIVAFEPNMHSVQFLCWNTRHLNNVVILPCALTRDGKTKRATCQPNFQSKPEGPSVATIAVRSAIESYGHPSLVKLDVEGAEMELLKEPLLRMTTLIVEWHGTRNIVDKQYWKETQLDKTHSLLAHLT